MTCDSFFEFGCLRPFPRCAETEGGAAPLHDFAQYRTNTKITNESQSGLEPYTELDFFPVSLGILLSTFANDLFGWN
jgi:hypothetical protein